MQEIKSNRILHSVQQLLTTQTEKGLAKYGTTVYPNNLTTAKWIDHASEEIIDLLVYLQVVRERVNELTVKAEAFDAIHTIMNDCLSIEILSEKDAIEEIDRTLEWAFMKIGEGDAR